MVIKIGVSRSQLTGDNTIGDNSPSCYVRFHDSTDEIDGLQQQVVVVLY